MAKYFNENAVDLVEMTTHECGGVQPLLVGNTADRLTRLGFPLVSQRAAEQRA